MESMVTRIKNLLADLKSLPDGQELFFLTTMCDELKLVATIYYIGHSKDANVKISQGMKIYGSRSGGHLATLIRETCLQALSIAVREEVLANSKSYDIRVFLPGNKPVAELYTAILEHSLGFATISGVGSDLDGISPEDIVVC